MTGKNPLTDQGLATALANMAEGKRFWLQSFSRGPKKRSDQDIAAQQRNFDALVQASNYFQGRVNIRAGTDRKV